MQKLRHTDTISSQHVAMVIPKLCHSHFQTFQMCQNNVRFFIVEFFWHSPPFNGFQISLQRNLFTQSLRFFEEKYYLWMIKNHEI